MEGYFISQSFLFSEKKSRHIQYRNNFNYSNMGQPQSNTSTFQSSTVTYGGPNGAYYTSSTTKRMGGDGVSDLECICNEYWDILIPQ